MKKILTLVLFTLCLILPSSVSAHKIKTDAGTTVELHLQPDDSALAGEPTRFEFGFERERGEFDVASCVCNVTVRQGEKVIAQGMLAPGKTEDGDGGITKLTFPKTGQYTVELSGRATNGSFPDFRVSFPETISRTAAAAQRTSWPIWQTGLVVAATAGILFWMVRDAARTGKR